MRPLNRWFTNKQVLSVRRAERRQAPGLAACHWNGSVLKQDDIRDISCTGVYLLTNERWVPGTLVSLTLQKKFSPEEISGHRIALQAKAVRCGDDGVGLSFVPHQELDRHLWESLLECSPNQMEPEDVLREFRMAKALAFLSRTCPPATEEVRSLLCGGLSNFRALSAVEIALKAEEFVDSWPNGDTMRAHPHLVLRILEDGSWADEDWILHMWGGLLATSCTYEGQDESNLFFVHLFSQLAATHVRVFAAACKGSSKVVEQDGSVSSEPLLCTREEIIKTTGWHDLVRIERDLEHMSDLGLLEKNIKSSSFSPLDEANITPSPLALKLYAHCNGYPGAPQEFYGEASQQMPVLVNQN
ncbi:MAG: hypothetical protein WAM85_15490 [Terracidiphilus sp.]